ncbi:MAG TPA: Ig-like domain repeat protein [Acidimicrobiales bacterium]|nr:Ig-like domain repeat protein [Acidimicrobiales bacterium]
MSRKFSGRSRNQQADGLSGKNGRNGEKPGRGRHGFTAPTKAAFARSGLAVFASLGVLASPFEMGVSAAQPLKHALAPGARAASAVAGGPTCAPPTLVPNSGTSTNTVSLKAGPTLLGDDADPLGIIGILADGAESWGEDYGLGWLLNLVSGQQPNVDAAKIQSQVDTIDSQLGSLAQQQYQDCQDMLSAINKAVNTVDKGFYDDEATDVGNYVNSVENYQSDFNQIVDDLQADGGDANALSSQDKQDLEAMLSGTPTGLRGLVDQINQVEGVAQAQSGNLVQLYAKILAENFGYDPYKTHIFPAAFVDAAYAQIDYYAEVVEQAAFMYANVAHLNFKDGTNTYTSDPESIVRFLSLAETDLHGWSVSFSDGPLGDGTANWVSQGEGQAIGGPIPDDTVLDYRVQSHPMLWTDSPVALNGYPASPTPYYCASTAQFCYDDTFVGGDVIGDTNLVLQSPEPLSTMITDDDYDGLSGWRVPTMADWQALEAGATSELTVWGPAHHFDMFAPASVTSHFGGKDASWDVIPPVLVSMGAASGPYGVLDWYPGVSYLTLERPSFGGSPQNDIAGRLFLVQDFQPAATPPPFSASSLEAPRLANSAAPQDERAVTGPTADSASQGPRPAGDDPAAQVTAQVPGPTTFSTPSACSSANSYTVPDGVAAVQVSAIGGAGAPGLLDGTPNAAGGLGGIVTETFPVTPGDTLYVQVGGAAQGVTGGVGGGGNAGAASPDEYNDLSGGGGGASGVSSTSDCSQWLVVAGGGGGGGSGVYSPGDAEGDASLHLDGGQGGSGCPETGLSCQGATAGANDPGAGNGGQPGQPAPHNQGGIAGQPQYSSATGGNGSDGGMMAGGNGGVYPAIYQHYYLGGGGGGAGYFGGGGGGGAGYAAAGGGGAGGASFAVPGGSNIGYSVGTSGQNGSVTITPVAKTAAPISVSASSTSLAWGQLVSLTATLPTNATGSVGFYDNSLPGPDKGIGTASIVHGQATLTDPTVPLAVGTHSLYAWYGGDTHYLGGGSAPVAVTVSRATPTLALTVNGTTLAAGQDPKSLVAEVPANASGKVTFYDDQSGACEGTSSKPSCNVLGVALIDNGYAAITPVPVPLAQGTHSEFATYDGDGNYLAGKSNVVIVTVKKAAASGTAGS